jgi:hypothetical protein
VVEFGKYYAPVSYKASEDDGEMPVVKELGEESDEE